MDDLISRKALLKELRKELRECRKDGDEFGGESILWAEGIEFAIDAAKQIPSVDAVEVVRCKDCKHYDSHGYKICKLHSVEASQFGSGENIYMERDDFCSYGERRGEDDD